MVAGDVIYLVYTPKAPAEGVHFGVMNTVTYPKPEPVPVSASFQSLSTGVQGEKGLTYYMSPDGVELVPFANFVADGGQSGNGAWINEDGTIMDVTFVIGDPNQNPDFMVGKVHDKGSVVMEYKAPVDGPLHLWAWAVGYGSEFTLTIATGTLDNVVATVDVPNGAAVANEYDFELAAGDAVYMIYTPKAPAEGVHFGVMNTVTYNA